MKKKILSLLLATSMLCSLMPTAAFAAPGDMPAVSLGEDTTVTVAIAYGEESAEDAIAVTLAEGADAQLLSISYRDDYNIALDGLSLGAYDADTNTLMVQVASEIELEEAYLWYDGQLVSPITIDKTVSTPTVALGADSRVEVSYSYAGGADETNTDGIDLILDASTPAYQFQAGDFTISSSRTSKIAADGVSVAGYDSTDHVLTITVTKGFSGAAYLWFGDTCVGLLTIEKSVDDPNPAVVSLTTGANADAEVVVDYPVGEHAYRTDSVAITTQAGEADTTFHANEFSVTADRKGQVALSGVTVTGISDEAGTLDIQITRDADLSELTGGAAYLWYHNQLVGKIVLTRTIQAEAPQAELVQKLEYNDGGDVSGYVYFLAGADKTMEMSISWVTYDDNGTPITHYGDYYEETEAPRWDSLNDSSYNWCWDEDGAFDLGGISLQSYFHRFEGPVTISLRVPASEGVSTSEVQEIVITRAEKPDVPVVESITTQFDPEGADGEGTYTATVTLEAIERGIYNVINWDRFSMWCQLSNVFSGLDMGTHYLFNQQVAPAGTVYESNGSSYLLFTTPPAPGQGYTVDFVNETIRVDDGYEVSTNRSYTTTVADGGTILPGTSYVTRVAAARDEDWNFPASDSVQFDLPARPQAPLGITAVATSAQVTITAEPGVEYSFDGGNWTSTNDATLAFGVEPADYEVTHTISARVAAVAGQSFASVPFSDTVNTVAVGELPNVILEPVTYAPELTLADVTLPAGWAWEAPETALEAGNDQMFNAIYTPEQLDTAEYATLTKALSVTVLKATPLVTVDDLTAVYGDLLSTVTLPERADGVLEWMNPDATVGNAGSNLIGVKFTPNDTKNYNTAWINVTVVVARAQPDYTVPTDLTATYGETLADVELPENFYWQMPAATPVGDVGDHSFEAFYSVGDSNYVTVENISINVNVTPATPVAGTDYVVPTGLTVIAGDALNTTALPTDEYAWVDGTDVLTAVGEVTRQVTFTSANTNFAPVTFNVTVTVVQLTPVLSDVTASAITYGDTLADSTITGTAQMDGVTVDGTFSWQDDTIAPAVKNSGATTYTAIFTPDNTTRYTTATAKITLTVNKADLTVAEAATASMTYGQTLADVAVIGSFVGLNGQTVTGGFAWVNPDTAPTVADSGKTYPAIFTPNDENYNVYAAAVVVTVGKATPSVFIPYDLTATYGDTLADVALPTQQYAWVDPDTTSVGAAGENTFQVVYTEDDSGNYYSAWFAVTIKVAKADLEYTVPTDLTATYGDTLSSVELPDQFVWVNPTTAVGNVGDHTYYVDFVPTDSSYNSVANIPVTVTVEKAEGAYTVPTGLTAEYGDTLADVTLPTGFSWADAASTSVGDVGENQFKVTFTPADTVNYTGTEDITVTIAVGPTDPVVHAQTASYHTIYVDGQLPAISTTAGDTAGTIAWDAYTLTAGRTAYAWTFTPDDTTRYNTVTGSVLVSVSKRTPTVNPLVNDYDVIYTDGQLPSITTSARDTKGSIQWKFYTLQAGTRAYTWIFTPDDTDTYETITGEMEFTVSVKPVTPWVNPFQDVNTGDWFYDAVQSVNERGLMNGITAVTFAPNSTATRAMVVAMLYRMAGAPEVTGTSSFYDVSNNAYYADAVIWGVQTGVVQGMDDTHFAPDQAITREQLAAMLYRYARHMGYSVSASASLNRFVDAPSSWSVQYMQWAVGAGIINGKNNNVLDAAGSATRAELAAMFSRFITAYAL